MMAAVPDGPSEPVMLPVGNTTVVEKLVSTVAVKTVSFPSVPVVV